MENLFLAWKEFRRGKKFRRDVQEFELILEDNIFNLHYTLKSGKYVHGGYSSFYVNNPKRRHIHKASVQDRLLHHAICRVIEPVWDKFFIFDSWSSRKNKGAHGAVRRLQKFGLAISRNNTRALWVLKLDIRKFFDSVDHSVLLNILTKKIKDKSLANLLCEIIESYSLGLPLGNLTSQLFANIYLNELDQFVKRNLKVKGYIRYADDFIIIHCDKEFLSGCLDKITDFLLEKLKLQVHPEKIILKRYSNGIDYLGYVCFPYHRILRTKTKRRMLKRITDKNFPSYHGILKHCRSYKLSKLVNEAIDG